jgi:hypothetical protein
VSAGAVGAARGASLPVALRRPWAADAVAGVTLAGVFTVLVALTWRKWGVPEIDAGAELTTADRVAHGALAYGDVRYFYGPLGLYLLAGAFKLFGTSFTTAYAFGLLQTAGIAGVTYALARRWMQPAFAAATTAAMLAIGFSGTAFNLVLPHTNSATLGVLLLLVALLALAHERRLAAGVAIGLVGLTRPEYVAVAAGLVGAYVIASWRMEGRRAALASLPPLVVPAVVIPVVVLGAFAAAVGTSNLLWQNLWPVDFIRYAGYKTQAGWMPLTAGSFVVLAARAGVYLALLAGVVAGALRWHATRGLSRLTAFVPLAGALVVLALADGAARALGILPAGRSAIETEARHLMIGMSWLPALALAGAAWAAVRLWRRKASPLGGSWPVDAALLVVAAGLGLRAYNVFTTETSYAPYYAAPLVVLAGILHQRIADRRPAAARASLGALVAVAAGMSLYAMVGLYADETTPVHTPRGTFVTTSRAAPAIQGAVQAIDATTPPGSAILAAPADGGLYFMTDRAPALHEVMLLPGLLATPASERHAIARLRSEHVPLAVVGVRDFTAWGHPRFGADFDPLLGRWLRSATASRTTTGTAAAAEAGTYPSAGFSMLRLRPGTPPPSR